MLIFRKCLTIRKCVYVRIKFKSAFSCVHSTDFIGFLSLSLSLKILQTHFQTLSFSLLLSESVEKLNLPKIDIGLSQCSPETKDVSVISSLHALSYMSMSTKLFSSVDGFSQIIEHTANSAV